MKINDRVRSCGLTKPAHHQLRVSIRSSLVVAGLSGEQRRVGPVARIDLHPDGATSIAAVGDLLVRHATQVIAIVYGGRGEIADEDVREHLGLLESRSSGAAVGCPALLMPPSRDPFGRWRCPVLGAGRLRSLAPRTVDQRVGCARILCR